MAKPTRFLPVRVSGPAGKPIGWRLNVPARFTASGKRERHTYRTRDEALDTAAKLRELRDTFGIQKSAITPSLAEQATAAARMLEPYGIPLIDVVQRYIEAEERKRASVPVQDAVKAFQEAGAGRWSQRQIAAYRVTGERLCEAFKDRPLSTIEGQELNEHIERISGTATSFNNNARLIRAFWNWCARPPRKWCEAEPSAHLEKKTAVSGEIGVLTPGQAQAVMDAAATHFPDCVPPFAIALFTGMRRQEIERLRPEDITQEGITVPAVSAKTKRRRFIHMPEPLAEWLKVHPVTDFVCPPNWSRKHRAVRRLAGFAVWSDMVPAIDPTATANPPEDLPKWPENALRHTAATVALAHGKPLEQLVFEHGHTGGLEMLRRHYIGALTKADAIKIWNLRPKAAKAARKRNPSPRFSVA